MRFHLEKRVIVSNQAGPNEISALYNESQGQNNVSPSCSDIITWVDASFKAIYSTYHYQMDIYLKPKEVILIYQNPKIGYILPLLVSVSHSDRVKQMISK